MVVTAIRISFHTNICHFLSAVNFTTIFISRFLHLFFVNACSSVSRSHFTGYYMVLYCRCLLAALEKIKLIFEAKKDQIFKFVHTGSFSKLM